MVIWERRGEGRGEGEGRGGGGEDSGENFELKVLGLERGLISPGGVGFQNSILDNP